MNPVNPFEKHPTAFTKEISLTFKEAVSVEEISQNVHQCISEITHELKRKGCKLIGHIKGMIDADENGYLFFSTVSFDDPPAFKGTLVNDINRAKFIINVIIYGVEYPIVEGLVQKSIQTHLG